MIVCVIVLYRQDAHTCAGLQSLVSALSKLRREEFEVIIYDNGVIDQADSPNMWGGFHYVHDPANGKLLAAYTYALDVAATRGASWLMLLDQDTILSEDFLAESMDICKSRPVGVCAITPRLEVNGIVRTPYVMDHENRTVDPSFTGRSPVRLMAWNSGSILNVQSLVSINGFAVDFPLDNLDHATFLRLQSGDERVFVMKNVLKHDLSMADMTSLSNSRLRGVLESDVLFARKYRRQSRTEIAMRLGRTGLSLLLREHRHQQGYIYLAAAFKCLTTV